MAERVASDIRGIGYVSAAFVGNARIVPVKDEGFSQLRRLYLYVPGLEAGLSAEVRRFAVEFVDFVAHTPDGQSLVKTFGFEPIGNVLTPLCQEVIAKERVLGSIWFESGRYQPADGKVEKLIRLAGLEGASVLVRGFTDPLGDEEFNRWLSEQRARSVAEVLEKRGVMIVGDPEGCGERGEPNAAADSQARHRVTEIVRP
jgi:hypothetical protein